MSVISVFIVSLFRANRQLQIKIAAQSDHASNGDLIT